MESCNEKDHVIVCFLLFITGQRSLYTSDAFLLLAYYLIYLLMQIF